MGSTLQGDMANSPIQGTEDAGANNSLQELKLSAKGFIGYQKETPIMGPRVEYLRALYALPNEGDLIILREIVPFSNTSVNIHNYDSPAGTRSALGRKSNCVTVHGEDMVFRVRKCDQDRALLHSNFIVLDRVYPDVPFSYSIPTRWVVTGSTVCQRVELQEDGLYKVVDAGRNPILEV